MPFVDPEQARNSKGLRLVVLGGVPSPWSEAAKGVFDIKGIDYVAVRFDPRDQALQAWTGSRNAPAAMLDGEPARSGWGEILALGERLNDELRLVPEAPAERLETYGLCHELLGEGGLAWCARLLVVHDGLVSRGERGLPERAAAYLGAKYGYAPERMPAVRERVLSTLRYMSEKLEANRRRGNLYLTGARPSAADVYLVSTLGVLHPLPPEHCPMLPQVRHAFETIDPAVRAAVSNVLLEHRQLMFAKHLRLPREL